MATTSSVTVCGYKTPVTTLSVDGRAVAVTDSPLPTASEPPRHAVFIGSDPIAEFRDL